MSDKDKSSKQEVLKKVESLLQVMQRDGDLIVIRQGRHGKHVSFLPEQLHSQVVED